MTDSTTDPGTNGTDGTGEVFEPPDDASTVWIATEPSIDGSTYVVSLQAHDDVAVVLTPEHAMRYAGGVLAAAHRAAYGAAMLRQLTGTFEIPPDSAKQVAMDLVRDLPPLDDSLTAPMGFVPLVSTQWEPFLSVSVNDKPVAVWAFADAEQHALAVLGAMAVADLDAAYYRVLTGLVKLDEPRARAMVGLLAESRHNHSGHPEPGECPEPR